MVFVGPRPALHNQDDLVEIRTKAGIHELMPGVTGWAQVNGRDELSIPEKVKYDEDISLKFRLKKISDSNPLDIEVNLDNLIKSFLSFRKIL